MTERIGMVIVLKSNVNELKKKPQVARQEGGSTIPVQPNPLLQADPSFSASFPITYHGITLVRVNPLSLCFLLLKITSAKLYLSQASHHPGPVSCSSLLPSHRKSLHPRIKLPKAILQLLGSTKGSAPMTKEKVLISSWTSARDKSRILTPCGKWP